MAGGLPSRDLWRHVPGCDSDVESDSEAEHELVSESRARLRDVALALGRTWEDPPILSFVPPESPAPPASGKACSTASKVTYRSECCASLVKEVLELNGCAPGGGTSLDWALHWQGPGTKDSLYQGLHEYQRVNHFPASAELTNKAKMSKNISEMRRLMGQEFTDFVPETFILPEQVGEFLRCYEKTDYVWIVKPAGAAQGRGIFLLTDVGDLPLKQSCVVCRYVENPLLIQGFKFDLRIYVLVTSYGPLRAYVYREGLARFCCSAYSLEPEHLHDAYRHLTNYSINKSAVNFLENQEISADNYGHKWSLSALNRHLRYCGVDVQWMWVRIMDLLVKTLFSAEPVIAARERQLAPHGGSCFELYGFDVMVDSDLKPWLIEVNLGPSMAADSPLDRQIKSALLSDTFDLVGIRVPERANLTTAKVRARTAREQASQRRSASGVRRSDARPLETRVALDSLSEGQLRMVARALGETERRRNFIRLYPTRQSVSRYGALAAKESSVSPPADTTGGWLPSHLLASVLFGPQPSLDRIPEPSPGKGRAAPQFSPLSRLHSVVKEVPERTWQVVTAAQYFVRVSTSCSEMAGSARARIAQSAAFGSLSSFCRQLADFSTAGSSDSETDDEDVEKTLEGDVVQRIAVCSRRTARGLVSELWTDAAPNKVQQPEEGERPSVRDILPSNLVHHHGVATVVDALEALSPAEHESLLCGEEFRCILGPLMTCFAKHFEHSKSSSAARTDPQGPLSALMRARSSPGDQLGTLRPLSATARSPVAVRRQASRRASQSASGAGRSSQRSLTSPPPLAQAATWSPTKSMSVLDSMRATPQPATGDSPLLRKRRSAARLPELEGSSSLHAKAKLRLPSASKTWSGPAHVERSCSGSRKEMARKSSKAVDLFADLVVEF